MSDDSDRALIRSVMAHRQAGGAPLLGSHATAMLYHTLGLRYGFDPFEPALAGASREQLDNLIAMLVHPIREMQTHPTRVCPCCGSIVAATTN